MKSFFVDTFEKKIAGMKKKEDKIGYKAPIDHKNHGFKDPK